MKKVIKGHRLTKSALIVSTLVLALALVSVPGCQVKEGTSSKIGVVVSILPLADFVENIGKEKVEVDAMVPPGASPHTYEPTPSQMTKVSKAEVFVKVGSGVEFELVWMDKLIALNEQMLVIDASKGVTLREVAAEYHHEGEEKGDEEHDEGMDPDIWLSPLNAKIMVYNIWEGLVQVDPDNEAYYTQNRDTYLQKLDALDKEIRDGLAKVKNRVFMVFHAAWGYLARDYNLEQLPIEVGGKEPSAQDIINLIEEAKQRKIKVIFASPAFNPQSAKVIAKEIGGEVVFIDPLARDYISNLHLVLGELVQAME